MKERNQLRVGIFLANPSERTSSGSTYTAVPVAGGAGIRIEDGKTFQYLWVGCNQSRRCTSRRGLRDEWFCHEALRVFVLLLHLRSDPRVSVVVSITRHAKRRVGNQEEQECAYRDWPSPWPAFESSIQKWHGGKD